MRKEIEAIAKAMRDAQLDTGLHIPDSAVVIVPLGFPFDSVCGHRTIMAPTIGIITLAECEWRLAKAFDDVYDCPQEHT